MDFKKSKMVRILIFKNKSSININEKFIFK